MNHYILFGLVFIGALQTLAFVVAIVARWWKLDIGPLTLRGTDVAAATDLVAVYVESVHDHRFAFPTGVFRVDVDRTTSGVVRAREANFQGSAGFGLVKFCLAIPALFVAMAEDAGCLGLLFAICAGVFVAGFLIVPILAVALLEIVLRALLRSRVDAWVTASPTVSDAVEVRFELRGLSAFGIEPALRAGLAAPNLPARYATAGLAPQRVAEGHGRLNIIYGVGAVVATAAAVVAVATAPDPDRSSSPGSFASDAYASQPSDDEGDSGTSDPSDPSSGGDGAGDDGATGGPTPVAKPVSQAVHMERTVKRHWKARMEATSESLSLAYHLYGTPLRERAGGSQARWSESIAEDGLQDIDITTVQGKLTGYHQGVVTLHITTYADLTGCHRWNFTYKMRKVGSRWLMWDQNLRSKHNC
jgi:hypothetical protein